MAGDKPPEKSRFWRFAEALAEAPLFSWLKPLIHVGNRPQREAEAEMLREMYAHVQEIRAQLPGREDEVIAELARQGMTGVGPEEVERQVELMAYRGCLLRMPEYQYVESAGIASLERAVTLRLEEAYVDLEFRARERSVGPEREERELVERLERGELEGDDREAAERRLSEMSLAFRREEQRLSVGDVLRNRQVVVLGDPGSGKTTLVRYLTQTYALGPETVRERLGMEEDLVPIVIAAARFAQARADKPLLHLREFIREEVAAGCGGSAFAEMQAGRAAVLIDGLDEIPEVEQRIAVAKCVGELLAQCPDCRFVITSRIIGYGLSRVAGPEHVELAPFSDDQVREFAKKWWRAFEHSRHETPDSAAAAREAETLAETIFSSPKVLDLARNPLMIALTAIVQHQEGSLPDRRVELYDKALRMLVETWNKRRSLSAVQLAIPEGARLDYYDFCEVWAPIAFWMHDTQPTAGVHTVDLRNRLVEQLGDRVPDGKTAEATAESYIDAASRHTGLLRERGADRWSFFHQTFQEYLAAQQLVRRPKRRPSPDGDSPLTRALRIVQEAGYAAATPIFERATDSRWHEVIRLAVGYVGVIQRDTERAEEILNGLLAMGDNLREDPESLERYTYQHLLLVAGCVADQPRASSHLENEVVGRLLDACEAVPHAVAQQAFYSALKAMDHVRLQSEPVARCRELVTHSPSWRIREATARLLGQSPRGPETAEALGRALRDNDAAVRRAAAEALARVVTRDDLSLLQTLARDEDWRVGGAVEQVLPQVLTRDDLPLLQTLARDGDGQMRWAAAQALGQVVTRDDLPLLQTLAKDDDWLVRWAAAQALGQVVTRDDLPLLQTLAKDDDWLMRWAAARALGWVGTRDDLPLLQTLAKGNEGNERPAAAWALARILTRDDLPLLQTLAKDDDWLVRWAAAEALARIGTPDDLPLLWTLARDDVEVARLAAARALARIATRHDLPLLQTLAQDDDANVRWAAAQALARIVTRDDLPRVQALATDEDARVREAAAEGLARIGTRDHLPLLEALARDSNWGVRRAAAQGLAKVLRAQESRAMYERETDERAKEAYFEAMWYAVHGEG
jgi:HEAT repeat protein